MDLKEFKKMEEEERDKIILSSFRRLNNLTAEIEEKTKEIVFIQNTIKKEEKEVGVLRASFSALEKKKEKLLHELDAIKESIDDEKKRGVAVSKEISLDTSKLNKKHGEIKKAVDVLENELEALRDNIREYEIKKEKTIKTHEDKISALKDESVILKKEKDVFSKGVKVLENTVSGLEKRVEDKQKAIVNLEEKNDIILKDFEEKLKKVKAKLVVVNDLIPVAEKKLKGVEKETEKAQKAFEKANADFIAVQGYRVRIEKKEDHLKFIAKKLNVKYSDL